MPEPDLPPAPDPADPDREPEEMPVGPPNLELGGVFFPTLRIEGDPRDLGPPGEEECEEDLPEAFREKDDVDAGQAVEAPMRAAGAPCLRLARNLALAGLIVWALGPLAVYYALSVLTAPPEPDSRAADRTWAWVWLGVGAVECALLARHLRDVLGA